MEYKASIILACYNREKYIRRALDSLVALSRFHEFEIIVVDDCSTDESASIVEEYTRKHPNILLLKQEVCSGSPSRPRNIGIQNSTSDYLIFMDPDDVVINDGYSILLSKMEEYQSDILIATRVGVNSEGVHVFTDFIDERYTYTNAKNANITLDLLNRSPFILKSIYSKKLILENGITYNEKIRTSEDEAFDMRCVGHAEKITKVNDIVYQYTVEAEDSITTNVSLRLYEDLYDVMSELIDAYRISFSDAVIAERIVSLTSGFYVGRLAFLNEHEDVDKACALMCEAYARIGYETFDSLYSRSAIEFVSALKKGDLSMYVRMSYSRRIKKVVRYEKKLSAKLKKTEQKLKSTEKQLDAMKRLSNRKIVRPAVFLAKSLDKLRKKPQHLVPQEAKRSTSAHEENLKALYERGEEDLFDRHWVFSDGLTSGRGNGEALYRYAMENSLHDRIAYILDDESPDRERLQADGFNLVASNSLEHWRILKNAEFYFTSCCEDRLLTPWFFEGAKRIGKYAKNYPIRPRYKLVYLPNSVLRSDESSLIGSKNIYKLVVSSPVEQASLLNIPRYRLTSNQVVVAGIPRWDNLKSEPKQVISIVPAKRIDLSSLGDDIDERKLVQTHPFFVNWAKFCNSGFVCELAQQFSIVFVAPFEKSSLAKCFAEEICSQIKVVTHTGDCLLQEMVNTSKMLITDHSSLSFDWLYLDKPVLYFDFEQESRTSNYREMEYENFGFYCDSAESAETALQAIVDSDFAVREDHATSINALFPYRNGGHCERVFEHVVPS